MARPSNKPVPGPIEIPFYESPERLGAKQCPNCKADGDVRLKVKKLAAASFVADIQCAECLRLASTTLQSSAIAAVKDALKIWNGVKPDISNFLEADSEGVKYIYGRPAN